jgi:hypothetical protein
MWGMLDFAFIPIIMAFNIGPAATKWILWESGLLLFRGGKWILWGRTHPEPLRLTNGENVRVVRMVDAETETDEGAGR